MIKITIMVAYNMQGKEKQKPLTIRKSKKARFFKGVKLTSI